MDYSKVRSLAARKLIVALRADGFELVRQTQAWWSEADLRRLDLLP